MNQRRRYEQVRMMVETPRSQRPPSVPAWPGDRKPSPAAGDDPVDILLPLGSGSLHGNAELRFALRSIERHASGYRRVVVVGEDPGFLRESDRLAVLRRPEAACGNQEARIAAKLAWALASGETTPHVAMWNDDYVLLLDTDVRRLPFAHKGQLPGTDSKQARSKDRYSRALVATFKALMLAGRPTRHYDVHMPMLLQRDLFLWLSPWWAASARTPHGLVVKSVYANCSLDSPGEEHQDCKLKYFDGATIESKLGSRWVFSYGDGAMSTGLAPWLNHRLNAKSRFEK